MDKLFDRIICHFRLLGDKILDIKCEQAALVGALMVTFTLTGHVFFFLPALLGMMLFGYGTLWYLRRNDEREGMGKGD